MLQFSSPPGEYKVDTTASHQNDSSQAWMPKQVEQEKHFDIRGNSLSRSRQREVLTISFLPNLLLPRVESRLFVFLRKLRQSSPDDRIRILISLCKTRFLRR